MSVWVLGWVLFICFHFCRYKMHQLFNSLWSLDLFPGPLCLTRTRPSGSGQHFHVVKDWRCFVFCVLNHFFQCPVYVPWNTIIQVKNIKDQQIGECRVTKSFLQALVIAFPSIRLQKSVRNFPVCPTDKRYSSFKTQPTAMKSCLSPSPDSW